ncbi:MAG TPA: sorbosone dehydrogenase family protein [Candidatus Saccharimonadales bacterium]|nr:sorbosone dehydrogenase family protein [Candidatus Saccharimonadales bacterium]
MQASSAFSDFRSQSPGRVHHIALKDLPKPFATSSADTPSGVIERPASAWPKAPEGFSVQLYARGLDNPRLLRSAPNGDVFVAESSPGDIKVLRGIDDKGSAKQVEVFATGLSRPFGIAFYPPGPEPQYMYVGNTDSVVRLPYRNGDLKARGPAEKICDLPGGGRLRGGGHWTRDIAFSLDGKTMYVSVGSRSNDDDSDTHPAEKDRADVLQFTPDGSGQKVFASGIRNAVGIAVHPTSGELWVSVNERDELGDNLVPDYITHVQPNGFYGWPWWYMGGVQDPRHKGKHPELKNKVITPDVLLQPHNASLEMLFYQGQQFPQQYRGDIFAAEHGSWNRDTRTGYEVVRVPMHGSSHAENGYEDFLTGFVTPEGKVWGRPVGVAVAADGSLLVSDDGGNVIWRVSSGKI